MLLPNFIKDANPFQLAGPPEYFLRQLWEYDPSLVIVPSRQGFFYRLCQRRKLLVSEKVANDILKEQADTRMLASHSLVPFTTIIAICRWDDPFFFQELNRRAPWRMGGAKKYEAAIVEQERKNSIAKRMAEDERLTSIAKDSWLHYNKQIGTRSHSFNVKTSTPAQENKAPALIIPQAARDYRPTIVSGFGDSIRKR